MPMAKFLGELNVTFDDNGVVTEAVGEPVIVDGKITENAEIVARVKELAEPLDENPSGNCRTGECTDWC